MASVRSKRQSKRAASPGMLYTTPSKRKRILTPIIDDADSASSSPTPSSCSVGNGNGSESILSADGNYVFKNKNFQHSGVNSAKKRLWRNLKQILAMERGRNGNQDVGATYSSIEAPPSFKPAKKYSDLSGLPAKYKDPHTGIRYSTTAEFTTIKTLPMDIVSGYLSLRKAAPT